LERGARGTRRIASCSRSTRKTLPHVLATHLRLPAATGFQTRRGGGYYAGVFCAALRAQKIQRPPQGKRTTSFFSAWGAEIFSGRRAASRDGDQARERTAAHSVAGLACRRADRDGTSRSGDCRNDLRTPMGLDGSSSGARTIKERIPDGR